MQRELRPGEPEELLRSLEALNQVFAVVVLRAPRHDAGAVGEDPAGLAVLPGRRGGTRRPGPRGDRVQE